MKLGKPHGISVGVETIPRLELYLRENVDVYVPASREETIGLGLNDADDTAGVLNL